MSIYIYGIYLLSFINAYSHIQALRWENAVRGSSALVVVYIPNLLAFHNFQSIEQPFESSVSLDIGTYDKLTVWLRMIGSRKLITAVKLNP